MIDRIAKPALRAINPSTDPAEPDPLETSAGDGGQPTEPTTMNIVELKEKHPNLYASVIAEGEKQGETKERDRVCAHLTLGESSGDMKTAVDAITTGAPMTAALTAKYMAASMNRSAQAARQADSDAAGKAADGAAAPAPAGSPAAATPTTLVDLFASDLPAKTG